MRNWDGSAEGYRRSFAHACAGSVDAMIAATEEVAEAGENARQTRHLDVGCGDGRLAAAAISVGRAVVACDADASMCELARASAPGASVVNAALPALPWCSGSLDLVTANFVVNHLADPRAAVREMSRVCRRGGLVAATIWPAGGAGFGELLRPIFDVPGVVSLPDTRLPAALDFERSPAGLGGLLRVAGLDDVIAVESSWTWSVTPEGLWAGIAAGVATPGMTYLAQAPEVRSRMQQAFFDAAAAMSSGGVVSFQARAVMATGRVA